MDRAINAVHEKSIAPVVRVEMGALQHRILRGCLLPLAKYAVENTTLDDTKPRLCNANGWVGDDPNLRPCTLAFGHKGDCMRMTDDELRAECERRGWTGIFIDGLPDKAVEIVREVVKVLRDSREPMQLVPLRALDEAHRERDEARNQRNEANLAAETSARQMDEWKARAEKAEAEITRANAVIDTKNKIVAKLRADRPLTSEQASRYMREALEAVRGDDGYPVSVLGPPKRPEPLAHLDVDLLADDAE